MKLFFIKVWDAIVEARMDAARATTSGILVLICLN